MMVEPGIRSTHIMRMGRVSAEKYDFKIALFYGGGMRKRVAAILSAHFECGLTAD